eukprot:119122-Karenia_brevis.AAC.1
MLMPRRGGCGRGRVSAVLAETVAAVDTVHRSRRRCRRLIPVTVTVAVVEAIAVASTLWSPLLVVLSVGVILS